MGGIGKGGNEWTCRKRNQVYAEILPVNEQGEMDECVDWGRGLEQERPGTNVSCRQCELSGHGKLCEESLL